MTGYLQVLMQLSCMEKHVLSKSTFIKGIQCHKATPMGFSRLWRKTKTVKILFFLKELPMIEKVTCVEP